MEEEKKRKIPKRWIGCPTEADYFGEERKAGKRERKIAVAKDRSKYKKTDREKFLKGREEAATKKLEREKLVLGRVLSISNLGILVTEQGQQYLCSLRGVLKKEKDQAKNLVVVGDFVLFEQLSGEEGVIHYVEPRHSLLSRADNLSRRKEHLLAANIDQVIITVSLGSPPLRPPIVDRYLIATRKGNMSPVIVINKIDLLEDAKRDPLLVEQERAFLKEFILAYAQEGPVIPVSAITGEGIEALRTVMHGKASVFSGQSGVGKSSLINAVTGWSLRVGELTAKTQKGTHTTTSAQLLPLDFGGWCIDTPGIRSFGLWNLSREEVVPHFTEIFEKGKECRFPDCSHVQEQGCAVVAALEKGSISQLRYQSYIALLASLAQEHRRR